MTPLLLDPLDGSPMAESSLSPAAHLPLAGLVRTPTSALAWRVIRRSLRALAATLGSFAPVSWGIHAEDRHLGGQGRPPSGLVALNRQGMRRSPVANGPAPSHRTTQR